MPSILKELEEDLKRLQKSRLRLQKDRLLGEIVRSFADASRAVGVSKASLYRYRQLFPDFPALPTFKAAIVGWMRKHKLPRLRGQRPSSLRTEVVRLREQGLSFAEIGKRIGRSQASVREQWLRHVRHPVPSPPLDYKGKGL